MNCHSSEARNYHWHFLEVERPFTRADVVSKGAIHLIILGTDAWLPMTVFVFGLDTEEGRPGEVVTLSAIPKWDLGWLSTDPSEGAPKEGARKVVACLMNSKGPNLKVIDQPYCTDYIFTSRAKGKHYNYESQQVEIIKNDGISTSCFESAGATYVFERGAIRRIVDSD
jgi:hypothetical protein